MESLKDVDDGRSTDVVALRATEPSGTVMRL
jgi:hypothetical protein